MSEAFSRRLLELLAAVIISAAFLPTILSVALPKAASDLSEPLLGWVRHKPVPESCLFESAEASTPSGPGETISRTVGDFVPFAKPRKVGPEVASALFWLTDPGGGPAKAVFDSL